MKRVTFVVLDEADRMFDMGFEPQIMRIIDNVRPSRQTVMFSATFPRSVEAAARKILKKPLELIVGARSVVCGDVEQHVEVRSEESKLPRLLELLNVWQDKGSILIFVYTQESVDELFCELLKRGFQCYSLHGGHDQADRDSTITDFKKGLKPILVATSLMARGLDVPELNLVVNFDCPNHLEDYVHRVGRTGRAGRKGWAYTFITPEEERFAPDIVAALKSSKAEIPTELKQLADAFKEKKKAGLAQGHGTGYGGKGHQFNETEAMMKKKAIKQQKKALGMDEGDEDESSEEEEAAPTVDDDKAVIRKVGATEGIVQNIGGVPVKLPPGVQLPGTQPKSVSEQALQQVVAGILPPGTVPVPGQLEAARKAAMLAQMITARKNLVSTTKQGVERYESELEINDYPQQARWKVTHKDALSQITELTGAAITTRGTFVKPGANPPLGDRKLYLFIEGPSEAAVKQARIEIKRILEEATLLGNPQHDAMASRRYGFDF